MNFILNQNLILKTITKEILRIIVVIILGFILIVTVIKARYKTVYEVKLGDEILGYVEDKEKLQNRINDEVLNKKEQNIESISIPQEPEYEKKFVPIGQKNNEDSIIAKIDESKITTYKFYAVSLNNKTNAFTDTLEEAEKVVAELKKEYKNKEVEIELMLEEKYTQNLAEVKTETVEQIEKTMEGEIKNLLKAEEAKKALATINGINLSVLPVSGRISSRFGAMSSIRSGAHTGLDIACAKGTKIKVVAKGKVVFAQYNGAYGNLIKVDHGNGIQTWYAHCDKILAKVGNKVEAGDVIGKVGTTGNSTGPHLHLEIRINGTAVNPQKYLYK